MRARLSISLIAASAAFLIASPAVFAEPQEAARGSADGSLTLPVGASSSAAKPNFDKQRKVCWKFRERWRVRLCLNNVDRREKAWERRNTLPTMTMKKAKSVATWAAKKTFERQWPGYEPTDPYSGYWAGECDLTSRTAAQCEWSTWMTYDYGGGNTSLMTCRGLVDLWYISRYTIGTDNHTVGCVSE